MSFKDTFLNYIVFFFAPVMFFSMPVISVVRQLSQRLARAEEHDFAKRNRSLRHNFQARMILEIQYLFFVNDYSV